MPGLPPESDCYPATLFDHSQSDEIATGRHWRVLHTRPRQEKSLARELSRAKVPFYLPLIARRSLSRGRIVEPHLPLFPGYLFLLANQEGRIQALSTKRVVSALPVVDQVG